MPLGRTLAPAPWDTAPGRWPVDKMSKLDRSDIVSTAILSRAVRLRALRDKSVFNSTPQA